MIAKHKSCLCIAIVGTTCLCLTLAATVAMAGMPAQAAKASKAATPHTAAAKEEVLFPHMDQALAYLRASQRELKESEPWFGDHRQKAIDQVGSAIQNVQAGIDEYMQKHPSATRNEINPDTIEVKMGHHFEEGLRLAQQGQDELNKAEAEFYGKRLAAIAEVKSAQTEMQAGIDYYHAHPHNK